MVGFPVLSGALKTPPRVVKLQLLRAGCKSTFIVEGAHTVSSSSCVHQCLGTYLAIGRHDIGKKKRNLADQRPTTTHMVNCFIATLRVARLTAQTPTVWLVGVATIRDARHACLRFFSFFLFFCRHKKNKKRKEKNPLPSQKKKIKKNDRT